MLGGQRDRRMQLARAVKIDRGEQLFASSVQQGAARARRAFGETTVRHREQGPDTDEGSIEPDAQPLGEGDAHPQTGERARPDADAQAIQARFRPGRVAEHAFNQGQ